MLKSSFRAALLVGLLALPALATARESLSFSIGIGSSYSPTYRVSEPVVVAAPRVYAEPVYAEPVYAEPVVVAPRRVVYAEPVVVAPRRVIYAEPVVVVPRTVCYEPPVVYAEPYCAPSYYRSSYYRSSPSISLSFGYSSYRGGHDRGRDRGHGGWGGDRGGYGGHGGGGSHHNDFRGGRR